MRHFVSALFGASLAVAGMAQAEGTKGAKPGVVVELYTSQGCSSCPPADEFFSALAADPQVIALSLHVDYWDYIGWKDEFGNPKFTERQKAYAREAGSRMIYTPQMIVGGLDSVEGNQPHEIEAMIRKHMAVARDVSLQAVRRDEILVIRAEAGRPFDAPVRVQLVRYHPEATVDIHRGENAGRTVTYHNIVTSWQAIGEWTGEAPLEIEAEVPGKDPAVVILQEQGPSFILAAARVE
jgi:hypothetical protein